MLVESDLDPKASKTFAGVPLTDSSVERTCSELKRNQVEKVLKNMNKGNPEENQAYALALLPHLPFIL